MHHFHCVDDSPDGLRPTNTGRFKFLSIRIKLRALGVAVFATCTVIATFYRRISANKVIAELFILMTEKLLKPSDRRDKNSISSIYILQVKSYI